MKSAKAAQLQIRVTAAEKASIQRAARDAHLGMSAFVLGKVLPDSAAQWQQHLRDLVRSNGGRIALAGLSGWLSGLSSGELRVAVASAPPADLSSFESNYVAAMVESACSAHDLPAPQWTREIAPLREPAFGTELMSLRLHLLVHSPPPFRRRNLFIDTSVGGQV